MATMAVNNLRRAYVTPEIYFYKHIDNSRVLKVADPRRQREMLVFSASLTLLLAVLLVFSWQHYRSIEYGYRNEALRAQCRQLQHAQQRLQLEEAELRDPVRIEELAKQMGLQAPVAGQVVTAESGAADGGAPELARATPVTVISEAQ